MSYEVYEKLKKRLGVRDADVVKATGLRKGTFSDWKHGKYEPKSDKRQKIADYFGVSLYYLDTGFEAPETLQLSLELMRIVEPFITRAGAKHFMEMCNALNDTQYHLIYKLLMELTGEGSNGQNAENSED